MDQLDVLIVSCDGYKQYVPICIRALKEVLPDALQDRIFLTSQTYTAAGVRNLPTGSIETNPTSGRGPNIAKDSFTSRVLAALRQLEGCWVFFVQEDHWYSRFPETATLEMLLETMQAQAANSCKLHKSSSFGEEFELVRQHRHFDIVQCDSMPFFPLSHHATIYRREWLIQNLERGLKAGVHTPWQVSISPVLR